MALAAKDTDLDGFLSALRAAAEPTRLRLLALLAESALTVTELTQVLGQSQPRVSRHLKLLCDAGLVERFREGNWIFYRLIDREGVAMADLAAELIRRAPRSDRVLAQDRDRLNAVRAARAEIADQYFRTNAASWNRIRALHVAEERVEAAVKEIVGPETVRSMVDLGTGTGRMLELLAPQADRAVGVDVSREMLAIARDVVERSGLKHSHVRQGDMLALPFADGSFDMAIMHQVLHFLHDPAKAVTEAARVLGAGGRLLIVDFAPHNLEELRESYAHRRLGFTEREVDGWAAATGLKRLDYRVLTETENKKSGPRPLTVAIWLFQRPVARISPRLEVAE